MNEESGSPILTEIPRYAPPQPPSYVPPVSAASTHGINNLNILLFALTLLTTTTAGALMAGAVHPLLHPSGLLKGLSFSLPLMAILLAHEMGHFITARRNQVNTSWPYFLPAPFPSFFFFGTFGAFIHIREQPRSRRVMFDIGAAGPWAGALLAVVAVIVGLHYSEIGPLDNSGGLQLGNSLLFWGLARWVLGVNPDLVTVNLNPIALAGWIGLFVTTFNLLPAGQLDGGHVVYALFGRYHKRISRACVIACILIALVPAYLGHSFWLGWLLWAGIIWALGLGHPQTTDADTPLDRRRWLAAWLTVALFVVTFSPVPLWFSPPSEVPTPAPDRTYSVVAHPAAAPLTGIRL
jgi:membrane-associated protease RseP (regulator of RpoE activity)